MEQVTKKAQELTESVMRKVDEEFGESAEGAGVLHGYFNARFPEISKQIQTKKAAFNLLEYSKGKGYC